MVLAVIPQYIRVDDHVAGDGAPPREPATGRSGAQYDGTSLPLDGSFPVLTMVRRRYSHFDL